MQGFGRGVARKWDPETRIPEALREAGRERLRRQVLVAPPAELVQGGPAEDYERQINDLFRSGCRDLIADFRSVTSIDSAGVRALVRSHTTAQRLDARFTIVAPQPAVRRVLALARLDAVFDVRDSLDAARVPVWRQRDVRLSVSGAAVCAALWWASASFPLLPDAVRTSSVVVRELGKLVAAGAIGLLVTAVHRRFERKPMLQAVEHAQLLLAVAGALVMMIIGESLARAFGIAGAAGIIRFRTPIEDPKDITVLFILMALGMACGIGAFGAAAAGTGFVCAFLVALQHIGGGRRRTLMVEIGAAGKDFPIAHVQRVFARNHVVFEPRELTQKKDVTMVYHATLDPAVSIEDVSAQLVQEDAGVTSVSWEPPKRNG